MTESEIPSGLEVFVSEFRFPTGTLIRLGSADGAHGWVIDVGTQQYLYSDGTVADAARYRALADLGFHGGEDDFRTDDDWARCADLQRRFSEQLVMPLHEAWELARRHGHANRRARPGETATLRSNGSDVRVVRGSGEVQRFVRVLLLDDETTAPLVVRLSDLRFHESGHDDQGPYGLIVP